MEDYRAAWPVRTPRLRVTAGLVSLRSVRRRDAAAWSRARLANRELLERWEATVPNWTEENARHRWGTIYRRMRQAARRGTTLPCAIEVDGRFAGQLTLGDIRGGALQSGWIGYWVDERFTGGGVATAAVALGVDHAFGCAGLHRVEATVRPENAASRAVLENAGFRREGRLVRYLHVDGEWRDHLLYAITVEEEPAGLVHRLMRAGRAFLPTG